MTGSVGLHELVGSVAGAIVDAQGLVERHFIDQIGRYFDAKGRAYSFDIKLPRTPNATDDDDFVQLGVPLLALVESSMLAIKEMHIALDVELGDVTDEPMQAGAPMAAGAPRDVPAIADQGAPASAAMAGGAPQPSAAAATMAPPTKALSVSIGGRKDATGPIAKLSIKVEARPPSEGLLRLITQLNKAV